MVCKRNSWVPKEARAGPGAPPCEDNPSVGADQCSADSGHCHQMTEKGSAMDKDCAGTCGLYTISGVISIATPFLISNKPTLPGN